MEKFEIDEEKRLDVFSNFVGKVNDSLTTLIENSQLNIKKYEQAIEDANKEISETELAKEKCEHEITKMEGKITLIKENIENVENTYKKIMDAYSTTSKGETREIYSEIIDGAKANCDRDVEKNKREIARLNSDIDAIRNNILEFTKSIDELNKDLEGYNLELKKYQRSSDYFQKYESRINEDMEIISSNKPEVKKKVEKKAPIKKDMIHHNLNSDIEHNREIYSTVSNKEVAKPEKAVAKTISEEEKQQQQIDSLKQIYDLTGYKPKNEEIEKSKVQVEKTVEKKEPAPASIKKDVEPVKENKTSSYDENDMSEWERILNGADDVLNNISTNKNTPKYDYQEPPKNSVNQEEESLNIILKPYGTTYQELLGLVGTKMVLKNGMTIPFKINVEDVKKAVNFVDATDLRQMKTVGPEITLLRKVKKMKEGNN